MVALVVVVAVVVVFLPFWGEIKLKQSHGSSRPRTWSAAEWNERAGLPMNRCARAPPPPALATHVGIDEQLGRAEMEPRTRAWERQEGAGVECWG